MLRYLLEKINILGHSSKGIVIDVLSSLVNAEVIFICVEQLVHIHLVWTLLLFNP